MTGSHEGARSLRRQGAVEGWTELRIAQEIHRRCNVSLLRAHRLARGWTLQHVADRLRAICATVSGDEPALSHQRVSRWEQGGDMPSMRYLDALCRLYRTRPDLLGFGNDYTEEQTGPASVLEPTGLDTIDSGEGGSQMERRRVLTTLLAGGGVAASAKLAELLQHVRSEADALLETQSVSAATVDDWESLAHEYGALQLSMPPHTFLLHATSDLARVRAVLAQRQPLEFQRRLYRVMAQLAGLIATGVNTLGDLRETRAWFHSSRLAAEETGDRRLRAWVVAY